MTYEVFLRGVLWLNVESIKLINFRNYNNLNIELNDKINVFIGKMLRENQSIGIYIYLCYG